MKAAQFSVLLIAAASLCAVTLAQAAQESGKTRAEVRQELVQAQHEGTVPASKNNYPPNADTITRNKELHAISKHRGETSPALDRHDGTATR
jgi:hypothetical protein